jgi:hypothetical protein
MYLSIPTCDELCLEVDLSLAQISWSVLRGIINLIWQIHNGDLS